MKLVPAGCRGGLELLKEWLDVGEVPAARRVIERSGRLVERAQMVQLASDDYRTELDRQEQGVLHVITIIGAIIAIALVLTRTVAPLQAMLKSLWAWRTGEFLTHHEKIEV